MKAHGPKALAVSPGALGLGPECLWVSLGVDTGQPVGVAWSSRLGVGFEGKSEEHERKR